MSTLAASNSLTPLQNFGIASFAIVLGVMSAWIYLKQSDDRQLTTFPNLDMLTVAPVTDPGTVDPDAPGTWTQFGEEAYAAGRIVSPEADNALYYFDKALTEVPDDPDARIGLERVIRHLESSAESAIFRGDWATARKQSEQLLTIRPGSPRARTLLNRINRFEQLESLSARADRQVASARLTEPAGDNALETYRRILEIAPDDPGANQGIASIVQRLLGVAQSAALAGEQSKARTLIRKVRAIDPTAPGIAEAEQLASQWNEMVTNQQIKEQLEAASVALQNGMLVAPDEPNALALFEGVLTLDPTSEAARQGKRLVAAALVEQCWALIRAGRFGEAEQAMDQARGAGAESAALVNLQNELDYATALERARIGEFDRIYNISELTVRRREVPSYPRTASGSGWVEVYFTINEEGKVVDPVVQAASEKSFQGAALRAIERWRFEPHAYRGRPIPVRSSIRFSFEE